MLYKNTVVVQTMNEERDDFAAFEFFLERTAIREIDGGLKRFWQRVSPRLIHGVTASKGA